MRDPPQPGVCDTVTGPTMNHITFDKTQETFSFTGADGQAVERVIEIRTDPLSGATSRILPDPGNAFQPPDYTEAARSSAGSNCPFCPENLARLTPNFKPAVTADGKIVRGQATVFPNLFPYSAHNGVVVLGPQHYLGLADFSEDLLLDGFMAAQDYVRSIQRAAGQTLNAAINWNYLPASGGSILHPHLHATLSHSASNHQRTLDRHGLAFRERAGIDYLNALCRAEQALGERWVGQLGTLRWLHAFAPRSHNDFIGVFQQQRMDEVGADDWRAMIRGLRALFATLQEQGLASFNLVLTESKAMPLHLRLISRIAYGGLQTSDINFFQILHQDPLSIKKPEDVAALARVHLQAAQ